MHTYYKKCLKTQKTPIKMINLLSLLFLTHYTTQHFCIYDIFRKAEFVIPFSGQYLDTSIITMRQQRHTRSYSAGPGSRSHPKGVYPTVSSETLSLFYQSKSSYYCKTKLILYVKN